jgi:O-Antigen ligase
VRPQAQPEKTPWAMLIVSTVLLVLLITQLVSFNLEPVAILIYVPFYLFIAMRYPKFALFLMFGSALFPYDLSGGLPVKLALGEISLVLATPIVLMRTRQLTFPRLLITISLYFIVCIASSVIGGIDKDTIVSLAQMAVYLVLAGIILANYDSDPRALMPGFYGIVTAGVFLGSVALVSRSAFVLGMNKNALGSSLSFATVACAELWISATNRKQKRWLGISLCIISGGLLFSLCRGAWAGTICGLLFIFAFHGRIRLFLKSVLVLVPILAVCWISLPDGAKEYASDISTTSNNGKARLISIDYAEQFFLRSPVFGVGVGLRKQYDATNVVMSTLAETGVLGLTTFLLIHFHFYATIWPKRRNFAQNSASSVIVAIAGGLVIAKFVHGCVDHYWARTLLTVWGSAAMAMGVCMRSSARRLPSTRSRARAGYSAVNQRPQHAV